MEANALKDQLNKYWNSSRQQLREQLGKLKNVSHSDRERFRKSNSNPAAFRVLVRKEIVDHVRSWRFILLLAIIFLTCVASLYTALHSLQDAIKSEDGYSDFVILKLFTISDGTLPSFIGFIGFLGPLLGIGLGFDAVNSERNKGTLSRIMAQPIHRDDLLNAKFTASLIIIGFMFLSLGLLVLSLGFLIVGLPPSFEELLRIISFLIVTVVYIGFWLNLSILFSVRFRQPATSALAGIAIWLFFSFFYDMILNLLSSGLAPKSPNTTVDDVLHHVNLMLGLSRISPYTLFNEATSTLLMPTVRNLGPLTTEQAYGAIDSPLPFGQSLLLVWPQVTGLITLTLVCFAISYVMFLRQEIRGRS